MTEARKTFLRVAEIVGAIADVTDCTLCGIEINDDYSISVSQTTKNIRITLVKKSNTGSPLDNVAVKREVVKFGASDKVITNRYNSILSSMMA